MRSEPKEKKFSPEPEYSSFAPDGVENPDSNILLVDEFEVIRLVDHEKRSHEQCARIMDISRTTVTEIYERARFKIADALVQGKGLHISGGNYQICQGRPQLCGGKSCWKLAVKENRKKKEKETGCMKIAVTYQDGEIFQHFGHTEQFKVYDVEEGKIVKSEVVDSNGNGHGALAGFLSDLGIDVLICGGIGGGAQAALAEAGIRIYGGVSGDADAAAHAYVEGKLDYDPDVRCSHHEHEEGHSCGTHGCGSHSCHE